MIRLRPPFPEGRPPCFRSTIHGTVFNGRDRIIEALDVEDEVRLVADPPVPGTPEVWVHLASGEPIGYLPAEIGAWLWPWMSRGGVAQARLLRVRGADVPSWRRLLVEVSCVV